MSDSPDRDSKVDPHFALVINKLNSIGAPYYVGHGSLLGLIRESRLLPWDGDIDICFRPGFRDRDSIHNTLLALGFRCDKRTDSNAHYSKPGGRKLDVNFYDLAPRHETIDRVTEYDIISWTIYDDKNLINRLYLRLEGFESHYNLAHRSVGNHGASSSFVVHNVVGFLIHALKPLQLLLKSATTKRVVQYRVPTTFLQHMKIYYVEGVAWRGPVAAEEVLEAIYGPEWMTPKVSSVWYEFAVPEIGN